MKRQSQVTPLNRSSHLDMKTPKQTPQDSRRAFNLREAPTFYPTLAEFSDTFGYIESIRGIAEKSGICKIVPPKEWKPGFSLNMEVKDLI